MEEDTEEWEIDSQEGTISGITESTSAEELVQSYKALEYVTFVTDPEGKLTDVAGTGCVLYLNDGGYTIIVQGDVNGDAAYI